MKTVLAILFCLLMQATHAAPYQLEATDIRDLHAQALQRDYQLYIALPDSYATGNKRYPVVFVTDANYAFPIVRNIAQRLHKHAGMEEVIVVGLAYANGDDALYSRRRDYTPTTPRDHHYQSTMPGRPPVFGEASAYGRFIRDEVMPYIGARFRTDMHRTIYVGHSYGSLLGLQMLFDHPTTFAHYILGSPSLWFDHGVLFDRAQAYAATHTTMPASLYFGIGSLETLPRGATRARSEEDADMLADMRDFEGQLKARHYTGLTTKLEVFSDEDHASVFPFLLTHGLRAYLRKE